MQYITVKYNKYAAIAVRVCGMPQITSSTESMT